MPIGEYKVSEVIKILRCVKYAWCTEASFVDYRETYGISLIKWYKEVCAWKYKLPRNYRQKPNSVSFAPAICTAILISAVRLILVSLHRRQPRRLKDETAECKYRGSRHATLCVSSSDSGGQEKRQHPRGPSMFGIRLTLCSATPAEGLF